MGWSETQEHLERWGACDIKVWRRNSALYVPCSLVVQLARVGVRVILVPGCKGQAADAVSAYTQVKMEDAHKLFKIPKSECPDIWIRLPKHNRLNHGQVWKTQSLLWAKLYGHPSIRLLWERQFEKVLWKKFHIGLFVRSTRKRIILVCACGQKKKTEHRPNVEKYLWKTLIWENRHHPLTILIWVALNENAKQAKILWVSWRCRKASLFWEIWCETFPHGPMKWKVMQRNAWKDIANWRIKHRNNNTKSQLHVLTTINSKKKK